ncbi:MAG: chemotaxis protein CheA [Thermodesulfobacteriota bacterium]
MSSAEFAEVFREEAAELLAELESALLDLEKAPTDLKLVGRVFRALHTIKGSGAMFGFDDIASFTHHVETVMDRVREQKVAVTGNLIGLVLASRDHISGLLDAAMGGAAADMAKGREIVEELQVYLQEGAATAAPANPTVPAPPPGPMPEKKPEPASSVAPPAVPSMEQPAAPAVAQSAACGSPEEQQEHFCIYFEPGKQYFEEGQNPAHLLGELRQLGRLTVIAGKELPAGQEEWQAGQGPFWNVLLSTAAGINAVRDVFIFAENTCRIKIVQIFTEDSETVFEHRKLGEILVERGDITPEQLEEALRTGRMLGEVLLDRKLVSRERIEAALAEQQVLLRQRPPPPRPSGESIKVQSGRLDQLINLVGELVVNQARLSQAVVGSSQQELVEPVEEMERLTGELRDCVLNIRMVPIGTTFSRFQRLVRDLSRQLDKEVELITAGEETELDKHVIDQLGEPLVHIIRNSVDHGIESREQRQAAGKAVRGSVTLTAAHAGSSVVLTVEDDGRGLDREKLHRKAVARGLLADGQEVKDRDLYKLVFEPGFSTSEKVTSVSGRGVGMDVVKTTIEGKLRGSVEVADRRGGGTTVAITLPLTLAIIDGLLVRAGDTSFVLPLSQVEECVELTPEDIRHAHGRQLYPLRGELLPYTSLRAFFRLAGETPALQQIVVANCNGERLGLVVDKVVGSHQTVIKSLGWAFRNTQGVSGATILGNGEIALIVDVATVIRQVRLEERRRRPQNEG